MQDKIAKKPNELIQAWQEGNIFQAKTLYWMLADFKFQAQKELTPEGLKALADREYSIPIKAIMPDYKKQKGGELLERIDKCMDDTMSARLNIDEAKGPTKYNLMSYMRLREGTSVIDAKFNSDVIPALVRMVRKGYTEVPLMDIRPLKSIYTIRIYELLLKHRKLSHVIKNGYILTFEELKHLLNISPGSYSAFGGFNRGVLKKAHKEINEKTTLRYEFEPIKEGKKYTKVRFYNISIVTPQSVIDGKINAEQTELFAAANPLSLLKPQSAIEIGDKHSKEYINYYYEQAIEIKQKGAVKSFSGLFFHLLTEDQDKFYVKEKAAKKEQKKMELKRAKREKEKLAEVEAENLKERLYEQRFTEAETKFNALAPDQQEVLLDEVRQANPILTETFVRRTAIDSLIEK